MQIQNNVVPLHPQSRNKRCPDGGIGRRAGLKHQWIHFHPGSTPGLGTKAKRVEKPFRFSFSNKQQTSWLCINSTQKSMMRITQIHSLYNIKERICVIRVTHVSRYDYKKSYICFTRPTTAPRKHPILHQVPSINRHSTSWSHHQ